MKNLRRHFTFAPDSEITLEANPDDITAEKLRLFRDLGINRLSLGVQSFDEAELRFLGRRHTARQTAAAIDLIRAAGFTNLGLDLMYGLPGQTPDAWLKTLETALSFAPEHLSCYQLTIRRARRPPYGRRMARRVARGEISLPDEETQREFFLLTANFLTARGYLHYEMANFARQGPQAGSLCYYCCRHNLKYWTRTPYLGLGPAAHSFMAGRRWWNISSVEDYCSSLNAGRPPVAEAETLTPEQIRLETLALGFRTREGVSLATIREHPGGRRQGRGTHPGRPGPGGPRPGHGHFGWPGGGRPPAPGVCGLRRVGLSTKACYRRITKMTISLECGGRPMSPPHKRSIVRDATSHGYSPPAVLPENFLTTISSDLTILK